jgi:hypothetical protein
MLELLLTAKEFNGRYLVLVQETTIDYVEFSTEQMMELNSWRNSKYF